MAKAKKKSGIWTIGAIIGVICIAIALCGFSGVLDGSSLFD